MDSGFVPPPDEKPIPPMNMYVPHPRQGLSESVKATCSVEPVKTDDELPPGDILTTQVRH